MTHRQAHVALVLLWAIFCVMASRYAVEVVLHAPTASTDLVRVECVAHRADPAVHRFCVEDGWDRP